MVFCGMIEIKTHSPDFIYLYLSKTEWRKRIRSHKKVIGEIIDPYLDKRQRQQKDPVLDFLFEYYAFRPSHLKKWSPGFGAMLQSATEKDLSFFDEMIFNNEGAFLNPETFPGHRKNSAKWILSMLQYSLEKKPSFGCFGMHEWAMVYKAKNIRHSQLSLRMPPEKLADFVESRPLVCTHFDAFRFFTDEAKPQNKFDLSRGAFAETEQPGCLHTNMDLYRWAFKMYPWIGSDLIRKAFMLALETRTIDMKASPYDLRDRGLEPIKIETEVGRLKYVQEQKKIFKRSIAIRKQLIETYQYLVNAL